MTPASDVTELWLLHWSRFARGNAARDAPKSVWLDLALPPFLDAVAQAALSRKIDASAAVAEAMDAARQSGTHEIWQFDASAARIAARLRAENPSPQGARHPPRLYGGPTSPAARYWLAGTAIWLVAYLLWMYLVGQHRYWHDDPDPWVIAIAPPALAALAYKAWKWAARA